MFSKGYRMPPAKLFQENMPVKSDCSRSARHHFCKPDTRKLLFCDESYRPRGCCSLICRNSLICMELIGDFIPECYAIRTAAQTMRLSLKGCVGFVHGRAHTELFNTQSDKLLPLMILQISWLKLYCDNCMQNKVNSRNFLSLS